MTDALLSAGIDRCRRAGTTVSRSTDAAEPPAIATPVDGPRNGDAAPSAPSDGDDTPSPEALLTSGRPVAVERLLSPPVGVPEADDDGRRFHLGPDRIRLEEGGYAAVPTGPDLSWHETRTPTDPAGLHASASEQDPDAPLDTPIPEADPAGSREPPWLELRAGGTVLARLAGVDALACPPRARFPYAYRRDRDKQIRVVDFAGRPVQRYPGFTAMRRGGFRPVPAPLVPERIFDGPTAGWWAVLPATGESESAPAGT